MYIQISLSGKVVELLSCCYNDHIHYLLKKLDIRCLKNYNIWK